MKRDRRKKGKQQKRTMIGIWLLMIVCIISMLSSADYHKSKGHPYAVKTAITKRVIQTMAPITLYEDTDQPEQVLISYLYEKIAETFRSGNQTTEKTVTAAANADTEDADNVYDTEIESVLTYEQILENEANDENEPEVTEREKKEEAEEPVQTENPEQAPTENIETGVTLAETKSVEYSMEKLNDFDYLIQNFYLVDKTTTITSEQLNAQEMLNKDMRLAADATGPQILIYHTHSQESYADHVEGDIDSTVVGMGNYLTALLEEKGFLVIHDIGQYDLEGRNSAYTKAAAAIEPILNANPSIEVVIDLHRDGVGEDVHMVSEVGGAVMAPIMFFNGLSRTTTTGDITYLPNPYIADNLAFSFQLQLAAAQYYPGWTRPVYLKGYRYNMHYRPKSLLIEVGAQTNTTQEAKNAMVPLADILYKVLKGE